MYFNKLYNNTSKVKTYQHIFPRVTSIYMEFQVLKEAKDSITKVLVIGHQILTSSLDCFVRTYDIRMGNLDADYVGSKK